MYKTNQGTFEYRAMVYPKAGGYLLWAEDFPLFSQTFNGKRYNTAEAAEAALIEFNRKQSAKLGRAVHAVYTVIE